MCEFYFWGWGIGRQSVLTEVKKIDLSTIGTLWFRIHDASIHVLPSAREADLESGCVVLEDRCAEENRAMTRGPAGEGRKLELGPREPLEELTRVWNVSEGRRSPARPDYYSALVYPTGP